MGRAMTVTGGRVVLTPGKAMPYKVVLEHERTNDTEHAFATVRAGEAFIRAERARTRRVVPPQRTAESARRDARPIEAPPVLCG